MHFFLFAHCLIFSHNQLFRLGRGGGDAHGRGGDAQGGGRGMHVHPVHPPWVRPWICRSGSVPKSHRSATLGETYQFLLVPKLKKRLYALFSSLQSGVGHQACINIHSQPSRSIFLQQKFLYKIKHDSCTGVSTRSFIYRRPLLCTFHIAVDF